MFNNNNNNMYVSFLAVPFLATVALAIPLSTRQTTTYAYLNQPCGVSNGISAYPGEGNKTLSGLCCSSWGQAGVTDDHCLLSNGCQSSYGRCVDPKKLPAAPKIFTACKTPGTVAISYDDGPSVLTASLLDYLKSVDVKVSFFVNGIDWKAYQTKNPLPGLWALKDVLLRSYNEGHQICSHTWSHTDFLTVNQWNVTYEMTRLNYAFKNILGVIPKCVRPPYGDYDPQSLRVLQGLGYGEDSNGAIMTWSLDEVDWDPASYGSTPQVQITGMQSGLQQDLKINKSFITLNHDTWNTTADFRVDGSLIPNKIKPFTQTMIEYMKAKNWKIVPLDVCLGRTPGSLYRAPTASDDVCGDGGSYGGTNCYV